MSCMQTLSVWYQKLKAIRWIRFCVVGGVATLSYILLGLLFVNLMEIPTLVGNALAYILSFAVSYLGQSRWTFQYSQQGQRSRMVLPAYALTQGFGFCLNSALIWLFTHFGLPYEAAMPITAALVAVVVYTICRVGVFRQKSQNSGGEQETELPAQAR